MLCVIARQDVSQDIKELTDKRLNKLSRTFTSQSEVRKLGIEGLGLPGNTVDGHISEHSKSIATAAYETIKSWFQSQTNREHAYKEMCEALRRVKMNLKIAEALQ